jgi:hypothetical protein
MYPKLSQIDPGRPPAIGVPLTQANGHVDLSPEQASA